MFVVNSKAFGQRYKWVGAGEEGERQKKRQRSLFLFGVKNLFNSLRR